MGEGSLKPLEQHLLLFSKTQKALCRKHALPVAKSAGSTGVWRGVAFQGRGFSVALAQALSSTELLPLGSEEQSYLLVNPPGKHPSWL